MHGAQLLQHEDVGGGDPLGADHLPHVAGPHTDQVKLSDWPAVTTQRLFTAGMFSPYSLFGTG